MGQMCYPEVPVEFNKKEYAVACCVQCVSGLVRQNWNKNFSFGHNKHFVIKAAH